MFFYLVAKNHKLWKTIENTVICIWNCYLAVSNKCENSKPSLRKSAWKMHRKRNRKSSEKCWKTTSTNMIQTLLKTCKFRFLFFIKIHQKSTKDHEKTRFKNRLGNRHHFLQIFHRFWCSLGTPWNLPGTIFHPNCYEGAGGKRFWTRFENFCMAFTTPGASGTTLDTI